MTAAGAASPGLPACRADLQFRHVQRLIAIALVAAACARCGDARAPSAVPQQQPPAKVAGATSARLMTLAEARDVIDAHASALPEPLRGKRGADLDAAWTAWAAAHDAAIRARLTRGDEDSIVNLWLYGTSFTGQPRATTRDRKQRGAAKTEALLIARLDDLIEAMAGANLDDRLRFARQVVERHGVDVRTPAGKDRAAEVLVGLRSRMIDESNAHYRATRAAAAKTPAHALDTFATLYRERGLSSDTSLPVDFSLDRALAAMASQPDGGPRTVRRVAVIGPGLDFSDKAEGYDLYPPQTIQPFALFDSLLRLKLAQPGSVRMTTFDLSPRVNDHLRAAAERARAGQPYVLHLPLVRDDPEHGWLKALEDYWAGFGAAIGSPASPVRVPPAAGRVDVRAVAVRPEFAAAIAAEDLDIVVQRVAPLAEDDRFDLVVATNVLVYYDAFEQALALANIASMLRPGAVFLTNYQVHPSPPLEETAGIVTPVDWDRQQNGDSIFVYRARPRSGG